MGKSARLRTSRRKIVHSLRQLLQGIQVTFIGPADIAIEHVAIHSQEVTPSSVFVAIRGVAADGHNYLDEAARFGAAALVVEALDQVPPDFQGTVASVKSGRDALNHMASRFFGCPGEDLFCIGITGTDGKSTVAWMVEALLNVFGKPTGVIGTISHHFQTPAKRHTWPGQTTPPPLVMQQRLRELHALGANAVVFEATSQALSQSRVSSVPLDVAIFTNLGRDHLDYHLTQERYFAAKERLFTEMLGSTTKQPSHAIVNVDTPFGERLRIPSRAKVLTYGAWQSGADLRYRLLATNLQSCAIRLAHGQDEVDFELPMFGVHNAANAAAAVAVGMVQGFGLERSAKALTAFGGVPGRAQRVHQTSSTNLSTPSQVTPPRRFVLVDYAHNPQAFDVLLRALRESMMLERPDGRLLVVFGCGGDRDRKKRPEMLRLALHFAETVYVTTDNPRSEDPDLIVREMMSELHQDEHARVHIVSDREKAIQTAIEDAGPRDVVAILGKGHERYQIIGSRTLAYEGDAAVAQECLAKHERE